MLNTIKRALKRFGRYLVSILIAVALYMLINILASTPVPEILAPLITALIVAISKYIRDTLDINLPF